MRLAVTAPQNPTAQNPTGANGFQSAARGDSVDHEANVPPSLPGNSQAADLKRLALQVVCNEESSQNVPTSRPLPSLPLEEEAAL